MYRKASVNASDNEDRTFSPPDICPWRTTPGQCPLPYQSPYPDITTTPEINLITNHTVEGGKQNKQLIKNSN